MKKMIFLWCAAVVESSIRGADDIQSKKRKISLAKPSTAMETDSDDEPLVKKLSKKGAAVVAKKPPRASDAQIGVDSDDEPIAHKLAREKQQIEKVAAKKAVEIRKDEKKAAVKPKKKAMDSDSDDEPLVKKKQKSSPAQPKKTNGVKKEESSDDEPLVKKVQAKKASKPLKRGPPAASKAPKAQPAKKEETEDAEEDDEEEERWWEKEATGDGTKKWDTLQHAGVVFPPPYKSLPKNVKMKYDGRPLSLHPDAEEVAGFFGTMLSSTHNVENPTFQKNFFNDFKEVLKETGGAKDSSGEKVVIKEFTKCDFKPIFDYYEGERAAKKAISAAEKKAIKLEKDKVEEPYMYCLWDGRRQKVGNFRVEPPGLFRGRGEHPKTGHVKKRVAPEQVTINIGKEATVPAPPEGHKWKEIKHEKEGTWLAMWQENINGNYKYVMLAANSDVKGQADHKKFEKARELQKHIDKIRREYTKDLKAELMQDRQRATAMYLIDKFALRAGNEKGEDEADTVGCCSLKFENITLREPQTVIFDFLGKDSIRFYNEVEVDRQVFKNLMIFKKPPKKDGDDIFDRLTTSALNKHLANYMPGLTAKVFRTYNASFTMSQILKDLKVGGTVAEKMLDYNAANRKVAILCNHKRTVAAGHAGSMEKLGDRIKGLKYQEWRVKQMMMDIEPKIKKKKGAEYFELPEDIDDDWIREHIEYLYEEQKTKITKKFEKDNEKLRADGEKEMKVKELTDRLEVAEELFKKLKKEHKSKKVEADGKGPTVEKLEANVKKLQERQNNMEIQAKDKEDNAEVALGTSKIVSLPLTIRCPY